MIIKSPVFKWHSNNGPFSNWTTFDHLNTRLVRYSDPPLYDKYGTLSIQIEQNGIKKFCLQGDKGRGGGKFRVVPQVHFHQGTAL